VEIKVPSEVKPGEIISLRIKAVPHSYLGLIAVDSRVSRDDDDNDFSLNFFEDVNKPLGGTQIAFNMGLVTMTNAGSVSDVKISKYVNF